MEKIIVSRRLIKHNYSTTVMFNDNFPRKAFQMSMPSPPLEDGTTLGWRLTYGKPTTGELLTAVSIMQSYDYLLSSSITTYEAVERLRALRASYNEQYGMEVK